MVVLATVFVALGTLSVLAALVQKLNAVVAGAVVISTHVVAGSTR